MNKQEFLSSLRARLKGLPKEDIDERINFYEEMINDRIDDGKSEEEAVADIGTVDQIIEEIARETPLVKLVKEKITPKRKLRVWEIILLVLGFPLWFPLALTAVILALVFYLLIWVLVIVCYSVEFALVVSSFGALVAFFAYLFSGGGFNIMCLGISIMSAGGAFLFVFACYGSTKGTLKLSKLILTKIKMLFINKKGE